MAYAALPYALWRAIKRGGFSYWREYFGFIPQNNLDKPLIWIHAVSLGEAMAAAELINELHRRGYALLITHTTVNGRLWLQKECADKAMICALPLDLIGATARFIARAKPSLAIIMEAEYWPNLLATLKKNNIKTVLANARLGKQNARNYARAGGLMFEMASAFNAIAAQTTADKKRLSFFGAKNIIRGGNLKFDRAIKNIANSKSLYTSPANSKSLLGHSQLPGHPRESGNLLNPQPSPPPPPAGGGKNAPAHFGGGATDHPNESKKTTLLIAGARRGEEKLLINAMDKKFLQEFFVILAPRHPERANKISTLLNEKKITHRRRTDNADILPQINSFDVYLADSLGEMNLFYAACDVAIIGGSFLPYGGQNPIEAMAAGVPSIIGPHAENYRALIKEGKKANALLQAKNADDAIQKLRDLTADERRQKIIAKNAKALCQKYAGALQKHLQLIEKFLPSV